MQRSLVHFRLMSVAFLVCFVMTGCGPSYPYYTLGGNTELRIVKIHITETEMLQVELTSADIDGQTYQLTDEGEVVEKGDAKVIITRKGPIALAKKVEYKGKEVKFHEPVL